MTREEKAAEVAELKSKFENSSNFYITDSSALTVADVSEFRGMCHEKGIEFRVAKNTLIKKALESMGNDYEDVYPALSGPTALIFSEVGNVPAKVLKEFRKTHEKPVLKLAYIDTAVYSGDDSLDALSKVKSKEELIGDVLGLLQSPAKNVISALKSGGDTIAGLIKTLSERPE